MSLIPKFLMALAQIWAIKRYDNFDKNFKFTLIKVIAAEYFHTACA